VNVNCNSWPDIYCSFGAKTNSEGFTITTIEVKAGPVEEIYCSDIYWLPWFFFFLY